MTTKGWPDIHALRRRIQELTQQDPSSEELAHLRRVERRSETYGVGWGTHIPLLAAVVACTEGPILEIGSGLSSTPLLWEMAKATGRGLLTLESNVDWIDVHVGLDHPWIETIADWSNLPARLDALETGLPRYSENKGKPAWSVIFIDNDPGHERARNIERCRGRGEFIVVHDTLNPWFHGMDEVLDSFRYRYDYTHMTACTSVVSSVRPYPGAPAMAPGPA